MLALSATLLGRADDGHAFPEAGKVYTIHRYSKANGYIYEQGNKLYVANSDNTKKQYWEFIPTESANRYYVRNVSSGHYMQSTRTPGLSVQISTGTEPVEYEVKACTAENAQKGYYYLCSTDQSISTASDGTLGLNFAEGQGHVVAFHITSTRPNSYWEIVESTYDYVKPEPPVHTPLAQRLGIYYLPCGTPATAWLKQLQATGKEGGAGINYEAAGRPGSAFQLLRNQQVDVEAGGTLHLAYQAQGLGDVTTVTVYFDWNADGLFEAKHEFFGEATAQADIDVPAHAATGRLRMRWRLDSGDMDEADDEIVGIIYDCYLHVSQAVPDVPEGIAPIGDGKTVCPEKTSPAYDLNGIRVNPDTAKGIIIQQGKKTIR